MNKNSLEDFRAEAKALKVPAEMVTKAEALMEKGLPYIQIKDQLPSRKGYMEATLHIKRSQQSDYYFFNKYELAYSKAKPLEEGKNYMVISTSEDGKKQFKNFKSPIEAIENFQKRDGNAELAIGKSIKDYLTVGTMKAGTVDYVSKDFQTTYYSDPIKNTVYVNKGVGFNLKQGANMLQGGSAYRDDLVSRVGKQYEAWNTYVFDKPRDNYGNLQIKQYSEGYGFNLQNELQGYKIKELDMPEKLAGIISDMKDGERPIVTVVNNNDEEFKMAIKAMPRYGNINFYHLNGQAEKREQFQKENKSELAQENTFSRKLKQQKSENQGLTM
ncbi:hypothetical protein [Pedobacter nyackensis]|uniref:Uncharacterized protein n=1 Tax=Pedobacter nyackensis TaxID=475255 RepID=A0A1W2DWR4_9SPHI|nr:hypothetical protein [Pedobacter nyackensis]SMD01506.1 hypothetical protein SAMN04488101_108181 [Pedobacter nyackensis]